MMFKTSQYANTSEIKADIEKMLFTQFNMTTCAGSDDFFKIKKFMDNF